MWPSINTAGADAFAFTVASRERTAILSSNNQPVFSHRKVHNFVENERELLNVGGLRDYISSLTVFFLFSKNEDYFFHKMEINIARKLKC